MDGKVRAGLPSEDTGMRDYKACWNPNTIERAKYLIDTTNFGKNFFEMGRYNYGLIKPYAPDDCQTVVDYGCGIGRVLTCWEGVKNRIGIDVSVEMLGYAKELYPDCRFIQSKGNNIPLKSGSVDFVYSLLVLQHMDAVDVRKVLKETKRVLRKGGTCWHLFSVYGKPWTEFVSLTEAHETVAYCPELIENLTIEAGLTVYEVKKIDAYYALIGGVA
jgi:SAM-dependent methyltransferase